VNFVVKKEKAFSYRQTDRSAVFAYFKGEEMNFDLIIKVLESYLTSYMLLYAFFLHCL